MDLASIFGASPSTITPATLLNPNQQKLQNWSLGAAQKGLSQNLDFAPIATAAQNRFQQQTLPSISERFAGMGAQRGSGYNQAVANAQRDLQLDLAGQQGQFQQQNQKTWADILGQGLRPSMENIVQKGQPNSILDLLKVVGPLALKAYLAAQTGGGSEIANAAGNAATGGSWFDWLQGLFGGGGDGDAGNSLSQNLNATNYVNPSAQYKNDFGGNWFSNLF